MAKISCTDAQSASKLLWTARGSFVHSAASPDVAMAPRRSDAGGAKWGANGGRRKRRAAGAAVGKMKDNGF